ncbi:MAG: pyrroline-5-carboxylate reductase [bacterium]
MIISLIGVGKMGSALLKGWLKAGMEKEKIVIYDKNPLALEPFKGRAEFAPNCTSAIEKADVVVFAVKPKELLPLLDEVGGFLKGKIAISIAAGVSLEQLAKRASAKWVRAMPNIACEVGEGFIAIAGEQEGLEIAEELFQLTGKVMRVEENLMDAITALSGSGPGFVSLLIDAIADGGVKIGLPKELSLLITAQTFLGTASLLLSSSKHPVELKDAVCSPAGTTIAGISTMEKAGLRGILMMGIEETYRRAKELQREAENEDTAR